jgi:hypothetical protein
VTAGSPADPGAPPGRSAPRLAVIGPSFFSYVSAIAAEFAARGFSVRVFDEKHSNRPLAKLRYRTGLFAKRWQARDAHLDAIVDALRRDRVTDVFLVNTESADRRFVERLTALGMRVHLYMWDGVANKPGFVAILDAVTSKASFDPRDCERFGMRYIPLFAEAVFDEARHLALDPPAYDIGFCGTVHSSRTAIVGKLLAAMRHGTVRVGLMLYYHSRALLYGKGLAQPAVWKIARAVSFTSFAKPEIARLFATSRLVLDVPHPGQTGLTARTFEVLAAGTRLLTTHDRARAMLPANLAERIVAVADINEALALDFARFAPLPPLRDEQRYFLSLARFVDSLSDLADLARDDNRAVVGNARGSRQVDGLDA